MSRVFGNVLGGGRTHNLRLRRAALYPIELQGPTGTHSMFLAPSYHPRPVTDATPQPRDVPVPPWALLGVKWVNSLRSGVHWSGVPFVTER